MYRSFRPGKSCVTDVFSSDHGYGVVPKGLLTYLGSLYNEVAKTTSGTLVYRFERQTARKKIFLPSKSSLRLRM